MRRVQVRFSVKEYELIKQQARSMGISIAEIVRRAVRSALPHKESGDWTRFAGFVESGNSKSSQFIDEIVYSVISG